MDDRLSRFRRMGVYGHSASATIVAKVAFYGSTFAALWLATRILAKPDYGSYVLAVAVMWFASVPVSLGLDQTVLVRVARRMTGSDDQGLVSAALIAALAVGTALAASLAALAQPLAQLVGVSGLDFWLRALAPTIPLIAIQSLCESWYVARGDPWRGQLFPALGHVVRVPVLLLALALGGTKHWVVVAEILVGIVPVVLFLVDRTRPRLEKPVRLSRADMIFGGRMLVVRIASEGVRRIDIFMLGALGTALAVADYHVASRLVVLLDLGRELLQPAFTARAGRFLSQSDRPATVQEYRMIRSISFLLSLVIATAMVLLATPFLALLGDFTSASPPLMLLIAGGLVNVAFGPNALFLKLAGHAKWLVNIRVAMLAMLFIGNVVLIPLYGVLGAASASLVAITLVNLMFWHAITRLEHIASIDLRTLTTLLLAVGAIGAVFAGQIQPWVGATLLGTVTIVYACLEPQSWKAASMALARLRAVTQQRLELRVFGIGRNIVLRVGILGCGRIARLVHIPQFARRADVAIVAIADSDPENLEAASALTPGAHIFSSWLALVDAKLTDAIVVTLPPAMHAEAATTAFVSGNHVYVEKPLALSMADGERLVEVQADTGRIGQIGLNFRHHPSFKALRARIAGGSLGDVVTVRSIFCSTRRVLPGWKVTRATGGSVLRELGVHHLDLVEFVLGERINRLGAVERSIDNEADCATVIGSTESGISFDMTLSLTSAISVNRVEVVGTSGHLVADTGDARPRAVERPQRGTARIAKLRTALARLAPAEMLVTPGHDPSFGIAFAAFTHAIAQNKAASPDLSVGLHALKLVMAAENAAAESRIIDLQEG